MNNNHRNKISFYKQIYNFGYLIAQFAHPSWLEEISVPAKVANDSKKKLAFQSSLLLQNVRELEKNNSGEQPVLLFIASLPNHKFNRFLNYLILAFLKNDKSLLINGNKLKTLSQFFSPDEIDFLIHEKEVRITLKENLSITRDIEITQVFITEIAFNILKGFFNKKNSPIFERLKYRFPKEFSKNKKSQFNFYIDPDINISCISTIAQALFPTLYSVFESDDSLNSKHPQTNLANKNILNDNENAYKITSIDKS